MSEQWHQHLNNLTWWEQIERFFNPNKYSCTTHYTPDWIIWLNCGLVTAIVIVFFVLWYYNKPEDKRDLIEQ